MTFIFLSIVFTILQLSSGKLFYFQEHKNAEIELMIPFLGLEHRRCFYKNAMECFLNAYKEETYPFCVTLSGTYQDGNGTIEWDPLVNVQYTNTFITHFQNCVDGDLNIFVKPYDFNDAEMMKELISFGKAPKHKMVVSKFGSEVRQEHQKNIKNSIQNCIRSIACYIRIHREYIFYTVEHCIKDSLEKLKIKVEDYSEWDTVSGNKNEAGKDVTKKEFKQKGFNELVMEHLMGDA